MTATTQHVEHIGEWQTRTAGQHAHLVSDEHEIPPHHDISEHDFLSVREPSRAPSTRTTMDQALASSVVGGLQHKKQAHRKLVLCFDGTGNKFHGDDSDSNILKIFRMLDRTASDQYHYYQPGIGTYVVSNSLSNTSHRARLKSWYLKAKDSAIGSSFDQHVVGGYRFLMRFYCPGDEIYIFGFSRGAYIARFLAEMLDYVGLLSHGNEEMVAFAWKAFSQWQGRRSAGEDDKEAQKKKIEMYKFMKGFRETFSRPVRRIRFLGLFDTVNSVPRFETAWMERSKFPYTARTTAKVIRHAVSIDERRAKFRQDLIYQSDNKARNHGQEHHHHHHHDPFGDMIHDVHEKYRHRPLTAVSSDAPNEKSGMNQAEDRGRRPSQISKLKVPMPDEMDEQQGDPAPFRGHSRSKSRATRHTIETASNHSHVAPFDDGDDDPSESEDETEQNIDEVWFAGGHGDIGGGWGVQAGTKSTSHVPLVWMVREAMKAGLSFDTEKAIALGCYKEKDDADTPRKSEKRNDGHLAVPGIHIDAPSPPESPGDERGLKDEVQPSSTAATDEDPQSDFHEMLHKSHVALIHDSLDFRCGLGFLPVLSWKIMEYMPFRRMDLQPDGTWKPIRWPLPCGEVRDIPDNVRVHGSVIRRMERDKNYRPGNLIVGGGGRGTRVAPESYGIGEWDCIENKGDPVSEIWKKRCQAN